jgi:hypothetical protein
VSTDPVGDYPEVELPDDFGDSTSWQRVKNEETRIEPTNRAEWMVRVDDGDRHRVVFGKCLGKNVSVLPPVPLLLNYSQAGTARRKG